MTVCSPTGPAEMSDPEPGDDPATCRHTERQDGVCRACGHCSHEVILNGACYFCGSTEVDGASISPRPTDAIIPASQLVRRPGGDDAGE